MKLIEFTISRGLFRVTSTMPSKKIQQFSRWKTVTEDPQNKENSNGTIHHTFLQVSNKHKSTQYMYTKHVLLHNRSIFRSLLLSEVFGIAEITRNNPRLSSNLINFTTELWISAKLRLTQCNTRVF